MTDPLDPITLPYLTTENIVSCEFENELAATKSLSDANLVAPYKLIGSSFISRQCYYLLFLHLYLYMYQ